MSKSSGGKGEEWLYQATFCPEAPSDTGSCTCKDNTLVEKMSELIDTSETIVQIWVYKCPLNRWQKNPKIWNHQFVVLQTANWCWSIEKNEEEIVIQKGKQLSCVRDNKKGERRKTPIKIIINDDGKKSLKDLIEFLISNNELNKPYHLTGENCQSFAKRVFDEFSKTKVHSEIENGLYSFLVDSVGKLLSKL